MMRRTTVNVLSALILLLVWAPARADDAEVDRLKAEIAALQNQVAVLNANVANLTAANAQLTQVVQKTSQQVAIQREELLKAEKKAMAVFDELVTLRRWWAAVPDALKREIVARDELNQKE